MKRLALAIALACVLSGSVLAGDAHSVGGPAPGDPSPPGDMGNGGNQGSGGDQGNGGFALMILDLLF